MLKPRSICLFLVLFFIFLPLIFSSEVPYQRVVAEWEPALGVMIRWPLGIPSELVIALAENEIIYVLVDNENQQHNAQVAFDSWGISRQNIEFIFTETYSHWTRDYGPQFLITPDSYHVISQYYNGYPTEPGCVICNEGMERYDCNGTKFCNDEPVYPGYDCIVNDGTCEDITGDGQINDWLGDGYCDDGSFGLNFRCDEFGWDCGDCGDEVIDPNGYCDDKDIYHAFRPEFMHTGRLLPGQGPKGWSADEATNTDFAIHMGWDILNLPLYFIGGNFMTDGYGMGFSTRLLLNENNMWLDEFKDIVDIHLNLYDYHIMDNPNIYGIQHIDCNAKLLNPETVLVKQVAPGNPDYECLEEMAEQFKNTNTFYGRPFNVIRIYCPDIDNVSWETNSTAAYVNSLILNNRVYVPLYGIAEDENAMATYQQAMPGYEVLGFFYENWYGEDALHCRTIGIFDPDMVHISHAHIRSANNLPIRAEAEIIDYSNSGIISSSVKIYWRYENENEWKALPMENTGDTYKYHAYFPLLEHNRLVHYFITAQNNAGRQSSHPAAGWHIFRTDPIIHAIISTESPKGIWKWGLDNQWERLLGGVSAVKLMAGNIFNDNQPYIIALFENYGLYHYSFLNNAWDFLTTHAECENFTIVYNPNTGKDLIIKTNNNGLYSYDHITSKWDRFFHVPAEILYGADPNYYPGLLLTFRNIAGLFSYCFIDNHFERIFHTAPKDIISGDITGEGTKELVCSFEGHGLFIIKQDTYGKTWSFHRITSGEPDPGHDISLAKLEGPNGLNIIITHEGRTLYYSWSSKGWSNLVNAPLKRIISGNFSGNTDPLDDLIVCESNSGSLYIYQTALSSWEIIAKNADSNAMLPAFHPYMRGF